MSIYKDWLKSAYTQEGTPEKRLWDKYLPIEQAVYENLLESKRTDIEGTVAEIGESFSMSPEQVCGFIDGINGCLEEQIDLETLEPETYVKMRYNFEGLYRKMVEYKASHLYNLPQWDNVIDAAHRRELYYEQKKSGTIIKSAKPGRNDPCPCGSGKKYKKCCGA